MGPHNAAVVSSSGRVTLLLQPAVDVRRARRHSWIDDVRGADDFTSAFRGVRQLERCGKGGIGRGQKCRTRECGARPDGSARAGRRSHRGDRAREVGRRTGGRAPLRGGCRRRIRSVPDRVSCRRTGIRDRRRSRIRHAPGGGRRQLHPDGLGSAQYRDARADRPTRGSGRRRHRRDHAGVRRTVHPVVPDGVGGRAERSAR